jgi:hypothetical protein
MRRDRIREEHDRIREAINLIAERKGCSKEKAIEIFCFDAKKNTSSYSYSYLRDIFYRNGSGYRGGRK